MKCTAESETISMENDLPGVIQPLDWIHPRTRTTTIMKIRLLINDLGISGRPCCSFPALRSHGLRTEARDLRRFIYGSMLDAGASTFWEEFAPRSSLCHAWGARCVEHLLVAPPTA